MANTVHMRTTISPGQFPTNSYHMRSVGLALKWVLVLPLRQQQARSVIIKEHRADYTKMVSHKKGESVAQVT